jgi:sugar lactone lactonase YvrE
LIREYESQLTQADGTTPFSFTSPVGISADSAGNTWVTDPGNSPSESSFLDKFDSSGKFVTNNDGTTGSFGTSPYIESVAWDSKANLLFVGDSNEDDLWGFKPDASYSGTDLNSGLGGGCCFIRVAADNSGGATDGDLYVFSREKVIRIDSSGAPVKFTAGAIIGAEENELSGAETPAGSFGSPGNRSSGGIAVGPNGRFYVADGEHHVVDIFSPSGEFVEAIKETESGKPLGKVSAVAVDPSNGNVLVADPTNNQIDEFSSGGAFLNAITLANGASFGALQGIAVAPSGSLYVADNGAHRVDVFSPGILVPDTITGPVSSLTDTSLTLHGTVNTAGTTAETALTNCHFEYVTEAAFKATGFSDLGSGGETPCVPAPGSIPNDGSDHAVSAEVSGLTTSFIYRYRLVAANSNGTNSGAALATPHFALAELVESVSATSADLGAEINPNGVEIKYHVEYLTEAEYEANGESFSGPNVPTSLADSTIPAGETPVSAFQHVQGLLPGGEYRFRLAISSSIGTVHSAGRAFSTQGLGAFELLDGRQWEQVSPPDKRGADVGKAGGEGGSSTQATPGGDAVVYPASGPTEANPPGPNEVLVLSSRGGAGWSSRDIAVPHEFAVGFQTFSGENPFFSEDLSHSIVQPSTNDTAPSRFDPLLSPEATEETAYLRTNFCSSSCYRPLVTGAEGVANVPPGTEFGRISQASAGPQFRGATPDASHIVITTALRNAQLNNPKSHIGLTSIPGDEGGLYEWVDGGLTLVSVLPSGEPASVETEPTLGFEEDNEGHSVANAISTHGSRVVWAERTNIGHLFLRDLAAEETVQLDAVQGGSGEGEVSPRFQTASADGSKVFFTDEQQLTADSGAERGRPDLYECQIVEEEPGLACELTDLTPKNGGESTGLPGTIVGASEDGSSVYFVSQGVLTNAPNSQGEVASPGNCGGAVGEGTGACNLYLYHHGITIFIATLSGQDQPAWNRTPESKPARVSPDGEWLAFMSQRRLTGYDNTDAHTGKPDQEVFLYHATGGGHLVCASCNPTGARPRGLVFDRSFESPVIGQGLNFGKEQGVAAGLPGWTTRFYQSRYLSNSGRLFFNSADALLPQDSDGVPDVYEYEPEGVGGCSDASTTFQSGTGGCLGLISSGTSSRESVFVDASESGDDAFFLTTSQLNGTDTDSSNDVYSAHVCSSAIPCLPPPPPPPPACEGDACQLPATPPNDPTPGSLSFHGAGNVREPVAHKKKRKAKKNRKGSHGKKAHKRVSGHQRGGSK